MANPKSDAYEFLQDASKAIEDALRAESVLVTRGKVLIAIDNLWKSLDHLPRFPLEQLRELTAARAVEDGPTDV